MAKKAAKKSTAKKSAKTSAKGGGKGSKGRPPKAAAAVTEAENSIDSKAFKEAVQKIEDIDEQILSERGKFMKKCQDFNALKDVVIDEAKNKGIPKKELKAVIKARDFERKADEIYSDLEPDEQDTFSAMRNILGDWADDDDTPLAKFARSQASPKSSAPPAQTQVEKDEQVERLARLGRGDGGEPEQPDKPPTSKMN